MPCARETIGHLKMDDGVCCGHREVIDLFFFLKASPTQKEDGGTAAAPYNTGPDSIEVIDLRRSEQRRESHSA